LGDNFSWQAVTANDNTSAHVIAKLTPRSINISVSQGIENIYYLWHIKDKVSLVFIQPSTKNNKNCGQKWRQKS